MSSPEAYTELKVGLYKYIMEGNLPGGGGNVEQFVSAKWGQLDGEEKTLVDDKNSFLYVVNIENQIHGADKERLERVVTVCEAVGKVSNQDVKGKMEEITGKANEEISRLSSSPRM